jgi:hypothetical protein
MASFDSSICVKYNNIGLFLLTNELSKYNSRVYLNILIRLYMLGVMMAKAKQPEFALVDAGLPNTEGVIEVFTRYSRASDRYGALLA